MPYTDIETAAGYKTVGDLKEALQGRFNSLSGAEALVVVTIHDMPDRFDFFVAGDADRFADLPMPSRNILIDRSMVSKTACDYDYVGHIARNSDFDSQFSALRFK
ncbi:MAG: hypothetical protein GC136_01280 [Alphaproteobacteria bacterium]|nr:hypothetical protein [Alphaproteobacteria bacterium]